MPARASEQIWPNQFWLRPFSWFSGFLPLFWRRLPLFSRGRCMRRQATTWHGRIFSSGGKKAAFNVGFAQFDLESFLSPPIWSLLLNCIAVNVLQLMFQHDVVGVDVGQVYWFLATVVFSCMPFFDVWFFPKCVFQSGFCRSMSVRWKLAPHLRLPRPIRPLYFTTVKPT